MEWILVIYIFVGMWGNTDSVSVTTTPMASKEACETAGQQLDALVDGSKKEVRYVCIKNH